MLEFEVEGTHMQCEENTPVYQLLEQRKDRDTIYAVTVNGKLHDLMYRLRQGGVMTLQYADSETGKLIYERSLSFLFITAVKQLYPDAHVRIEHSLSEGLYAYIDKKPYLTRGEVQAIEQQMQGIVKAQKPIKRRVVPTAEAVSFFQAQGMESKADLLRCRSSETSSIYELCDRADYFYGIMLPNTSYLTHFHLRFYAPGVWLSAQPQFQDQTKLFRIFQEFEAWGRLIQVSNIAQLNRQIQKGNMDQLVLMSESMMEKKLVELAADITRRKQAKFILIAGPSSAGKTTFSRRLAIHLRILGKTPITISMDDFYHNREDCPRLHDGSYDFESLEALDLELFNDTMLKLLHQEAVRMPCFNFQTGLREWKTQPICMEEDDILIIEGIHGLNPQTSMYLPKDAVYKIYINALTHLNLDEHNRIPTSDYRLIRRIVRDYQFRGWGAEDTIAFWKNVRHGEDVNIYPYQEEADAIFNSSMVYELSILKGIAVPLLDKVETEKPQYLEANRLRNLLAYFVEGSSAAVPRSSILAEFIGNSVFDVD